MIIRVAKCRFAKLRTRYIRGERKTVNQPEAYSKGVLCGLDKSHNADYEVEPCSAPLLAVHANPKTPTTKSKNSFNILTSGWMNSGQ